MRAMIFLHFPEQKTFSPERIVRSLTDSLPTFAEVRYPRAIRESFANTHEGIEVEFRSVTLPQSAMIRALQTGSVRAVWNDIVWRVSESTQENDGTLTLTAEREKAFVPPDQEPVSIGTDEARIGDDTPVLKGEVANG